MTNELPQESPAAEAMDGAPDPASGDADRRLAALEAVLFMAAESIGAGELADILEVKPADVEQIVARLDEQCSGRGIQVQRVAGGYQICTRPEYGPYVAKLHQPERFRLSRAALETLAIVAYKQPITRPEIEAIRGVNSDSPVDTLSQYELICEVGRKDSPGRPMLYRTTDNFLGQFGLNSVEDLPSIEPPPGDEQSMPAEPDAADGAFEQEAPVSTHEQPVQQSSAGPAAASAEATEELREGSL
jgi:segregation and condensation protein B